MRGVSSVGSIGRRMWPMVEGCGVGHAQYESHATPDTVPSRTRTQHLFFPPSAQTPTPQLKHPCNFQYITMNNTHCQLPSSSTGGHGVGSRGSKTSYPFQPLMALHNPRNMGATVSRVSEGVQRVEGKSMLPSDRTRSQSKIELQVLGVRQSSTTAYDARVEDRHPSGEKSNRSRTSSSTTSTSTLYHNQIHRPNTNSIEASGAVGVASRSNEARPSNAPRAHNLSPPSSVSGLQRDRIAYQSGISLQKCAENTQPSSAIQPVIAHIATRLNSEIVRLSPPLQAMANYLLRLMGARKEERLRWLEMNIPYLWVWMPPVRTLRRRRRRIVRTHSTLFTVASRSEDIPWVQERPGIGRCRLWYRGTYSDPLKNLLAASSNRI